MKLRPVAPWRDSDGLCQSGGEDLRPLTVCRAHDAKSIPAARATQDRYCGSLPHHGHKNGDIIQMGIIETILAILGVCAIAASVGALSFLIIVMPVIMLNEIDKLLDDVDEDFEGG